MKIYLSEYWRKSKKVLVVIILFCIFIACYMVLLGGFDIESITVSLLFVGTIIICLSFTYLSIQRLLRYSIIIDNKIINYNYAQEETATVFLKKPFYYDVKNLVEGSFSRNDFVIISNQPITLSLRYGENRLGVYCKAVDREVNTIICPCDDRIMRLLKNI